ncbi:hypothetical protein BA184_09290 [Helicobacter pullorum]|uniref:hypothetical protein n=1 Tax=Helicobacter pullorum TaxID=35818 RepID=UPI0008169221|nr:hypothetical protein [Helicobacter pullorum]OCR03188.1 hypothetical protein BA729_08065 [Helicobacter pullorum]OCR05264.1 hypothetical protein BA185_08495 [Helicobacter pullorum]OCR07204.1 hypothetical protein BA184_09290 [Helicobacter pullorum]OCR12185.1 hypothetical protein BA730_06045 [Helicobacter pullorum]
MVSTTCFMDLTKKAKIKGLTTTSWFIVIIGAFIAWFFFLLYAIPIAVGIYCILFILEFFDEDIFQILYMKFSLPINKYYA